MVGTKLLCRNQNQTSAQLRHANRWVPALLMSDIGLKAGEGKENFQRPLIETVEAFWSQQKSEQPAISSNFQEKTLEHASQFT